MELQNHKIPENYKRVYATVDLDAILHNMDAMHDKLKPGTKMIAVIKTDGYGHGAVQIAHVLEPQEYVYGFAVATAEEAFWLRKNGIVKDILILGYTFPYAYEQMIEENISFTVFREDMLEEIQQASVKVGKKAKVHVKIDTGMHRIGVAPDENGLAFFESVKKYDGIALTGIFTHFARADEKNKTCANEQLDVFSEFIAKAEAALGYAIPIKHCSNSAAILELPQAHMDLVRAGISLYGMYPSDEVDKESIDLVPVLSLYSHIVYIKTLKKGQSVSYGGTFTAKEDMTIATIPIGYGDGYPRGLSNKGFVLVGGKRVPILGRVCMDQMMVDVSEVANVKCGDLVTLIGTDNGQSIRADELGDISGRFHYELLCDLGKRIPRVYLKNGEVTETKDYYLG